MRPKCLCGHDWLEHREEIALCVKLCGCQGYVPMHRHGDGCGCIAFFTLTVVVAYVLSVIIRHIDLSFCELVAGLPIQCRGAG